MSETTIVIQNETHTKLRLPVASEDQEKYGPFLELAPKQVGAASRKICTEEALNRMRLEFPEVHDWIIRKRFTFK